MALNGETLQRIEGVQVRLAMDIDRVGDHRTRRQMRHRDRRAAAGARRRGCRGRLRRRALAERRRRNAGVVARAQPAKDQRKCTKIRKHAPNVLTHTNTPLLRAPPPIYRVDRAPGIYKNQRLYKILRASHAPQARLSISATFWLTRRLKARHSGKTRCKRMT